MLLHIFLTGPNDWVTFAQHLQNTNSQNDQYKKNFTILKRKKYRTAMNKGSSTVCQDSECLSVWFLVHHWHVYLFLQKAYIAILANLIKSVET